MARAQEVPGWVLVWSDEFSQPDGSLPDASKWGYDIGGWGWGNQEIQYYTDRSENARIEGGQLLIEAREESYGGRNHTSARLLTKGKWDWTYGRFETRVKVPSGSGLWPACWMLGSNIDSVSWPNCGEIDIMEQVGRLPKEVFGTIHGPGYSGGEAVGGTYTFSPDVADDYHVFVVEWDEDLIRWYVDGINYFTATPESLDGDSWVFDHDHFLILNLAVDGNFAGPLDESVVFPKQYWVDYVRVYTRAQDPGSNVLANTGFETGELGAWIGFSPGGANEDGGYVESDANTYYNGGEAGGDPVDPRSGSYVGKVFGDFSGGSNDNGFYQELSADEGSVWEAHGWAMTHPQDLMADDNEVWIDVSFLSQSDEVLSLYRSQVLGGDSLIPSQWTEVIVTEQLDPETLLPIASGSVMAAPVGSSKVRFRVVHRQPAYGAGSVYWDDLSLLQVVPVDGVDSFAASIEEGTVVTWTPETGGESHQVQRSSDGVNWADFGEAVAGEDPSSMFDPAPAAFYQVIATATETTANGVLNPGFEVAEPAVYPSPGASDWVVAAPEDLDASDGLASMEVGSSYLTFSPHEGAAMLVMRSLTPAAPAAVNVPNTNVRSVFVSVDEDTLYDFSFYAAHVVKVGGANPQFNLRYYDDGFVPIGQLGYESFASIGSEWTLVEREFTTPSGAAWLVVEWIQALGAGNDWEWVTLIDSVNLPSGSVSGGQSVLPTVVAPGVEVSWFSDTGMTYQVEESEDLDVWLDLGGALLGTGGEISIATPYSGPKKFYKVTETVSP